MEKDKSNTLLLVLYFIFKALRWVCIIVIIGIYLIFKFIAELAENCK